MLFGTCLRLSIRTGMSESPSSPTVYDHLLVMFEQLVVVAWAKLGLRHDPISGKLEPNLSEAKVAIDVVTFMGTQLEQQLEDEGDRRQIQNVMRDLKINFVQRSTAAGTGSGVDAIGGEA